MKLISQENVRLNKFLANNNICSRREADEYIAKGLVKINNRVAKLGDLVNIRDIININDNINENYIYYLYNKKPGEIINNKIEMDNTILYPVDNLHNNFSGLVLLTNDKKLMKRLEKELIKKRYTIKTRENIRSGIASILKRPVNVNEVIYEDIISANIEENNIQIEAMENNISNIPKILNALNLTVDKLERRGIEQYNNKQMKYGEYKKIDNFLI